VFRLSMASSVAAFASQTLASVALPFLLLEGLGRTPAEAGWVLVGWPLGTVLAAPVAARLIGRQPSGLLGGIGLALLATGLALLALLPAHPTAPALFVRLVLCGIGFGLFQSPNNHTIVTAAPAHRSGGAAGMLGTARLTGQSLGALVAGTLYALWASRPADVPPMALGLAAGLAVLGAGASLLRVPVQRR
jgi:DHA2 family multidrug resistance protein-like MFS transporter